MRWIARALFAVGAAALLFTSFRAGWQSLSTDFPNYYTAAVAVRHGLPLHNYYNWTWFARQMNYAGIEGQIGAYTPQTPLTMLPMVALTGLAPLEAKHVWLLANLLLLAAAVAMLARSAGIWWEWVALLLLSGHGSLASNLIYGQYYILLLFLMSWTYSWFDRGRGGVGGLVSGAAFALKLYTGPLLLYFAAKREWRAAAGMSASLAGFGALAVTLFGWGDVQYYLTHVLPRTLEGGSIDPYNPGVPSFTTLLHRLFVREPGLNPHPLMEAPRLFFVARTAVQLGILVFTVLGVAAARDSRNRRDFAWFVIALLLLSTSTASYTFLLLLIPTVLLLKDASAWTSAYLAGAYILITANLKPVWLFPKVWLLLLLYAVVGTGYFRAIGPRRALVAASVILLLSLADANRHMAAYAKEPGRRYLQIAVEPEALYSGYPAATRFGLFYQGMGDRTKRQGTYVLRWLRDGRIDSIAFQGSVLHPSAGPDGAILFELTAHGGSTNMRFDPLSGLAEPAPSTEGPAAGQTVSPDGRWAAYSRTSREGEEIWLKDIASGRESQVAGGACNNSSPAWEPDSTALIFASDCGRAFGLPALYRAEIVGQ